MPIVSSFYGIIISMYFEKDGKHHTPHFHARYAGSKAEFDFDGNILAGEFPQKQSVLVKAWALLHADELAANWELAMMDEHPYKIDPLK